MVANGVVTDEGVRSADPRRERLRVGIGYTLLALIVAVAGVAVCYRAHYYVWPGQGAGARVQWCERDYQADGSPQTWHQVTNGTRFPVRAEGEYPPLGLTRSELFASVYPSAQSSPSSCATVIYLRTAPQEYQPYTLLGGP